MKPMNIPEEFDEIRPFTPEELPAAFDELLSDSHFLGLMRQFAGDMPAEAVRRQLQTCQTLLDVQRTFIYPLIVKLLGKNATSFDLDATALPDHTRRYTFISNHRDIVIDPALLSLLLVDNGYPTTVEIAIGDNLLIYPWIRTLVRINKSFIVQRSLTMREMLHSSRRMSRYIHFAVNEKQENVWIAQREGRAKDSDDRTQESVLKMLAMGGPLEALNLVPTCISYEYDPCDYLKAKEFQQKRDNPDHRKTLDDDLLNMQTGIFGFKGRIHYCFAPCADTWLGELAALPKSEYFKAAAQRIDREIHRRYCLFPCNYAAIDLLEGAHTFAEHYTPEQRAAFADYVDSRVALVDLANRDEAFLRERILTMYANPLRNKLAAV